jgi:hypothetical protein
LVRSDVDGRAERVLARLTGEFSSLYLSPDGKKLLYSTYRQNSQDGEKAGSEVREINTDGSGDRRIIGSFRGDQPLRLALAWSRDGRRVLFEQFPAAQDPADVVPQPKTCRLDGSDVCPLGSNWSNYLQEETSPDGKWHVERTVPPFQKNSATARVDQPPLPRSTTIVRLPPVATTQPKAASAPTRPPQSTAPRTPDDTVPPQAIELQSARGKGTRLIIVPPHTMFWQGVVWKSDSQAFAVSWTSWSRAPETGPGSSRASASTWATEGIDIIGIDGTLKRRLILKPTYISRSYEEDRLNSLSPIAWLP